jgi:hypothetical protein
MVLHILKITENINLEHQNPAIPLAGKQNSSHLHTQPYILLNIENDK